MFGAALGFASVFCSGSNTLLAAILVGVESFGYNMLPFFSVVCFASYPDIKAFIDGLVESAKKKGYSVTMFNRRREIPELSSSNFMQRSFGERVAMNAPIQGTAADIIKLA